MKVLHKGTFLLTLAWCIQLLVGYAINMWLAKYFGPEVIGTYGTVMTILVFIEVGVLSGFPTAIQKFISARNEDAVPVLKRVSQLQFVYVVALFCLSIMAAPFIAIILNDQSLSFYIRIAVIDLWLYSFFFIFLHLQNALHHFGKQAILIIIYGISKLCFVYLLVLKTQSITGALIANFVGSAIGLVFGIIFAFSERVSLTVM